MADPLVIQEYSADANQKVAVLSGPGWIEMICGFPVDEDAIRIGLLPSLEADEPIIVER